MNLATVSPKYGLCVTSAQARNSRVSVVTGSRVIGSLVIAGEMPTDRSTRVLSMPL